MKEGCGGRGRRSLREADTRQPYQITLRPAAERRSDSGRRNGMQMFIEFPENIWSVFYCTEKVMQQLIALTSGR